LIHQAVYVCNTCGEEIVTVIIIIGSYPHADYYYPHYSYYYHNLFSLEPPLTATYVICIIIEYSGKESLIHQAVYVCNTCGGEDEHKCCCSGADMYVYVYTYIYSVIYVYSYIYTYASIYLHLYIICIFTNVIYMHLHNYR
jgi:DNA-directed RNA polymerase subunit RPC12/RpoP